FAAMLPGLVQDQWRRVFTLLSVTGVGLAVAAIVESAFFSGAFGGRASGLAGNPGLLAGYLVGALPVCLWLADCRRAWYAALPVLLTALYLSGTRTGFIAAFV